MQRFAHRLRLLAPPRSRPPFESPLYRRSATSQSDEFQTGRLVSQRDLGSLRTFADREFSLRVEYAFRSNACQKWPRPSESYRALPAEPFHFSCLEVPSINSS